MSRAWSSGFRSKELGIRRPSSMNQDKQLKLSYMIKYDGCKHWSKIAYKTKNLAFQQLQIVNSGPDKAACKRFFSKCLASAKRQSLQFQGTFLEPQQELLAFEC